LDKEGHTMKRILFRGLIMTLGLSCCYSVLGAQAAPALHLEAALPRETLLNLPVTSVLHFTNVQGVPLTIQEQPVSDSVRVTIRDAASKAVVYEGLLRSGIRPSCSELPSVVLKPGHRFSVRVVLGHLVVGRDEEPVFLFPRAGDYLVSFSYSCKIRQEQAPTVEQLATEELPLRVVAPDQKETDIWGKIPLRGYALFGMDYVVSLPTDKELEPLTAIVRDHPESRYSHYLALALGRHYRDESYRRGGGQGSEAEIREYQSRAMRYFRQAAEMKQVPWVREEAFVEWSRFLGHRGQPREAIQIARRALEIFPQGVFRDQLIELAQMPVENPVAAAERELAAAGYDYTELRQEQVQELRAFMYARDPDWAQAGPRSHHDEQQETARRMKQWFLKHLQPKGVSFSPDPFGDVQDELKALGYDLTTMTEDQLRDYDEYVDGTLDKARAANPKMSDLEYLTLQARLIKEWVLKNLKPTLPPKSNATATPVAPEPAP
jgi:hypothetical protein